MGAAPEERPALLSGGHGAPAAAAGLAQQRRQPQQGGSSPHAATAPGLAGASPPTAGMQRLDSGSSGTTAAAWQPEPASPGSRFRFRSGSGTLTAALLQTLQWQPSSSPPCAGALSLQLETTGSNILIELDGRLVLAGELPTPSAVAGSHPAQQRQPQLLPQQPAEWQPAAEAGPHATAQSFSPALMRFVPISEPPAGQVANGQAHAQARQQWPLPPLPIPPAATAWTGACLVAGQSSGGSSGSGSGSGSLFAGAVPVLRPPAPLPQRHAGDAGVEASLEVGGMHPPRGLCACSTQGRPGSCTRWQAQSSAALHCSGACGRLLTCPAHSFLAIPAGLDHRCFPGGPPRGV